MYKPNLVGIILISNVLLAVEMSLSFIFCAHLARTAYIMTRARSHFLCEDICIVITELYLPRTTYILSLVGITLILNEQRTFEMSLSFSLLASVYFRVKKSHIFQT